MQGLKLTNGVLTLGIVPQPSRCKLSIGFAKRDKEGNKTAQRVSLESNSGPRLSWFRRSNGGEQPANPQEQAALYQLAAKSGLYE